MRLTSYLLPATTKDIAAMAGISEGMTSEYLTLLRKCGHAEPLAIAGVAYWMTPAAAAEARVQRDAATLQRKQERQAARVRERAIAARDAVNASFERDSVRLWTDARQQPMPKGLGPRSVFDIACSAACT